MTIKFGLLLVAITLLHPIAEAQYYYKDLRSNHQAQQELSALKTQKIKTISVHSFEGDKTPSEGFFCEKKIKKNYKQMDTYTRAYTTGKSLLQSYYNEQGQLLKSVDSSEFSAATSLYQYNKAGAITSILSQSHSNDEDFKTMLIEEHQYRYASDGRPMQMLRIRNQKDSTRIDFVVDEQGNVTDEIDPSPQGLHYYYYYDKKNRLTDIVKFNVVLGKLLPDFTFEYNSTDQVTQMIAVEEGLSKNYYTWKYIYNDGLKIIEKCFSKENVLLGYFELEYQ